MASRLPPGGPESDAAPCLSVADPVTVRIQAAISTHNGRLRGSQPRPA